MKLWKYLLLSGLFFLGSGPVYGAVKVALLLTYPEGRRVRYKNTYSIEYFSDRAELILMDPGSISMGFDGEWRSWESVGKAEFQLGGEIEEGEVGMLGTIEKADSRALFANSRLTFEQYPFALDLLKGRQFSWRISPDGRVHHFDPNFRVYEVKRQDLVTDIFQFWMPGLCPVLPEGAVGEGDTWTGERTFERSFASMDLMGKKARMNLKSTYEVKKIKEKKGRMEVTIEETREFHYAGWLDIDFVSLYLEGRGQGFGEWVIDASRGVVLSHKVRLDLDRPGVTKLGDREPLDDIRAEVKMNFQRKLEKLEKE